MAVNRRYAKVRSLQYFQTWQIIVLIFFVSFSINDLKENVEILNTQSLICFCQLAVNEKVFLSLLTNAVNSSYDRGERCLSAVFFAMLTCWQLQFSKIFVFLFFQR